MSPDIRNVAAWLARQIEDEQPELARELRAQLDTDDDDTYTNTEYATSCDSCKLFAPRVAGCNLVDGPHRVGVPSDVHEDCPLRDRPTLVMLGDI